jgi:hypothetical protein
MVLGSCCMSSGYLYIHVCTDVYCHQEVLLGTYSLLQHPIPLCVTCMYRYMYSFTHGSQDLTYVACEQ